MGPKTTELCKALRELSAVLRADGDTHWSAWMEDARVKIEDGDLAGVDRVLGAYGGMGSFNEAGWPKVYTRDEYGDWGDRAVLIGSLKDKVYELAKLIRDSAVIEPD